MRLMTLGVCGFVMFGALFLGLGSASNDGLAAQNKVAKTLEGDVEGDPKLTGFQAIAFANDGTLFVGDGQGARIVAIKTGDNKKPKDLAFKKVEEFGKKLKAKLGVTELSLLDLAVNPASGKAYLAVQSGNTCRILTIDGAGAIEEFSTSKVRYSEIKLPLEKGVNAIQFNDLAYIGDKLIATACTASAFLAKIYVATAPFKHGVNASLISAETYHRTHDAWETAAPIERIAPYQKDGKTYVIGSFMCTPVARFNISDAKDGEKLRGITPLDFGPGKQARDLLYYEKAGKPFLIACIDSEAVGVVRIKSELLMESGADNVNEKAPQLFDWDDKINKDYEDKFEKLDAFSGALKLARFDEGHALAVRSVGGKVFLEALELP